MTSWALEFNRSMHSNLLAGGARAIIALVNWGGVLSGLWRSAGAVSFCHWSVVFFLHVAKSVDRSPGSKDHNPHKTKVPLRLATDKGPMTEDK